MNDKPEDDHGIVRPVPTPLITFPAPEDSVEPVEVVNEIIEMPSDLEGGENGEAEDHLVTAMTPSSHNIVTSYCRKKVKKRVKHILRN